MAPSVESRVTLLPTVPTTPMAADDIRGMRQRLTLPQPRQAHWEDSLPQQLQALSPGPLELIAHGWLLRCRDLRQLQQLLAGSGFSIAQLQTQNPQTAVSAQALGLPVELQQTGSAAPSPPQSTDSLRLHRGTLRAGDRLDSEGDLLVLGDVNPGATVTAVGDVMVWGRLRGVAHAGRQGDQSARIVALQLRPLQLRIADQVARGPEDQPLAGLAEEARMSAGEIVIEPADPRLSKHLIGIE